MEFILNFINNNQVGSGFVVFVCLLIFIAKRNVKKQTSRWIPMNK
jgi:hypothetical protein